MGNDDDVVVTQPAAAPAAPATVATSESSDSDQAWQELMSTAEDDDVVVEEPPAPDETSEAAATPPTDTPAPAAAPVAAAAQPAETPPAVQSTPPSSMETEETRQARIQEQRTQYVQNLETQRYKLDDATVAAVVASPEVALPKLLANVHANAVEEAINTFSQLLPNMLHPVQQQMTAQQELLGKFYTEWPELNDPALGEKVAQSLVAYRRDNPNATPDDVIKRGGLIALVSLGKPIPPRVYGGAEAAPAPTAAPVRPLPPAAPGGASTPPTSETNAFAAFAQQLEVEDELD